MEQKRNFIINVIYYAMILCIVYLVLQYVLPVMTPFISAFVIVWIMRIPASWIAKQLHLPEKPLRMLAILLFYGAIVTLLFTVGFGISEKVGKFANEFPNMYRDEIVPILNQLFQIVEDTLSKMDPNLVSELETLFTQLIQSVGQWVSEISVRLVKWVSNYAARVPSFFIKLIITIVSSFFIAADYDKVLKFFGYIIPAKVQNAIATVKTYGSNVLIQYLRSYVLIFCITCVELLIGFKILNIPYAFGLSIIIAIFDIMPIVGLGGVLIPWAVVTIVLGKYKLAIGLVLLYIIITIIRNVIEPKIIGMQIGLHPLATLVGMFVGLKLFGVLGLFGIPITMSICLQLYRKGLLKLPKVFVKNAACHNEKTGNNSKK